MKPVIWVGASRDDMRAQRETIQLRLGYQLQRVQLGLAAHDSKPMPDVGPGTYEIRVKDSDGIARLMYVAKFGNAVHVLHVFTKKSQRTPKPDMDIAKKRYKEAKRNG